MSKNQLLFFPAQKDLRKWFEKNHKKEQALFVGYYKVSSNKPSITWSQSVDEALCFGWIDGIRRSVDEESYCIRFTPRKPTSNWSAVNTRKAQELIKLGLMKPEGMRLFNLREEKKSGIYSYETAAVEFDKKYERKFKANKKAWRFFQSMAPSYQKTTTGWVMGAKQEVTRVKRLGELIRDCELGKKIKAMRY